MRKGILIFSVTVFAFLALFSMSQADDKFWGDLSGSWSDPDNWDAYGLPQPSDSAYLTQSDDIDRTVSITDDVSVFGLHVDATGPGTMTLDVSRGRVHTVDVFVGYNGIGIIDQSGGTIAPQMIWLGSNPFSGLGGIGIYNMSGGHLSSPDKGSLHVGDSKGIGIFNQTDGSVSMDRIRVGEKGVYNFSGGTTRAGGISIAGIVNQSGGSLSANINAHISEGGVYNLNGGTFGDTNQYRLRNYGTLNYSGGEIIVYPGEGEQGFYNYGTTNIRGAGTRTITGSVINEGTVKTTNTTVVYNGTFTNNGAYISDPSTQYFDDLIIGETGYLVGHHGDRFNFYGDFLNYSTMTFDWDTDKAYLGFLAGEDNLHDFYLAGDDLGDSIMNYADNFSWDILDISENVITLFNADGEAGAAQYIGLLLGAEILGDTIANIYAQDGINMYYNPHLEQNRYLAGLNYKLTGGGFLVAAVPEPSTILLMGIGLIGLAGWRRRKFKRN